MRSHLRTFSFFAALPGTGLVAKFRDAIAAGGGATTVGAAMFTALKTGKKAEFALDVLDAEMFETLSVPRYINEGLTWKPGRSDQEETDRDIAGQRGSGRMTRANADDLFDAKADETILQLSGSLPPPASSSTRVPVRARPGRWSRQYVTCASAKAAS